MISERSVSISDFRHGRPGPRPCSSSRCAGCSSAMAARIASRLSGADAPSRLASAARMLQSARACAGGAAPPSWCCTRPSRLVIVPWRSYGWAIGRSTSMRSSSAGMLGGGQDRGARSRAGRRGSRRRPPGRSDAARSRRGRRSRGSGAKSWAPRALAPSSGAPTRPSSPVAPSADARASKAAAARWQQGRMDQQRRRRGAAHGRRGGEDLGRDVRRDLRADGVGQVDRQREPDRLSASAPCRATGRCLRRARPASRLPRRPCGSTAPGRAGPVQASRPTRTMLLQRARFSIAPCTGQAPPAGGHSAAGRRGEAAAGPRRPRSRDRAEASTPAVCCRAASAARRSAASHVGGAQLAVLAHHGLRTRCSASGGSESKRPRSHSQPSSTAGLSRGNEAQHVLPSRLWTSMLQPTAQPLQIDGVRTRSHGRALKRYWRLVSAPTGQSSIVLPANIESYGSPSSVAISLSAPRSTAARASSPGISWWKRTQR